MVVMVTGFVEDNCSLPNCSSVRGCVRVCWGQPSKRLCAQGNARVKLWNKHEFVVERRLHWRTRPIGALSNMPVQPGASASFLSRAALAIFDVCVCVGVLR
jgi:hypothetical protein